MWELQQKLLSYLDNSGYKSKLVSIEHLKDLKIEIEKLLSSGLLSRSVYEKELTQFNYDYTNELTEARSIIVIAMPQPLIKLKLNWKGKSHEVIIPPVYTNDTDKQVKNLMETLLTPKGFRYINAALPLKLLAVKSGLSMYGRNNISYVPEVGSFNKLIAFITDMPYIEDSWHSAKRMAECNSCNACIKSCPTKCIDAKTQLIDAEKCITNFNEYSDEFPDRLSNSVHNSLIGCMKCQMICPKNIHHMKTIEILDAFSEDEVSLLLNNAELTLLPEKTRSTLEKFNLTYYYKNNILSRNLNVLINK